MEVRDGFIVGISNCRHDHGVLPAGRDVRGSRTITGVDFFGNCVAMKLGLLRPLAAAAASSLVSAHGTAPPRHATSPHERGRHPRLDATARRTHAVPRRNDNLRDVRQWPASARVRERCVLARWPQGTARTSARCCGLVGVRPPGRRGELRVSKPSGARRGWRLVWKRVRRAPDGFGEPCGEPGVQAKARELD